jgi:hypothetical protein
MSTAFSAKIPTLEVEVCHILKFQVGSSDRKAAVIRILNGIPASIFNLKLLTFEIVNNM